MFPQVLSDIFSTLLSAMMSPDILQLWLSMMVFPRGSKWWEGHRIKDGPRCSVSKTGYPDEVEAG